MDTEQKESFFFKNRIVNEHNVDHGVIGCMDFRLRAARAAFMASQSVVDYDNFVAPGSCQEMIEADGRDRTFLAFKVALGLHSAETVWLFQHTDCGAYGGSVKFDSLEEEINFQKNQLKKAKEVMIHRCKVEKLPIPTIKMHVEHIDKIHEGVSYILVE